MMGINVAEAITAAMQDQRKRDWSWLNQIKWPLRLHGGIADGRIVEITGGQPSTVVVPELSPGWTLTEHEYDGLTGHYRGGAA